MTDQRPYPQNAEYERALLGGLMLDPVQVLDVGQFLDASDFHRPDHRLLFGLLVELDGADLGQVLEQVTRRGDRYLEQLGGIAYIAELQDATPSTANLMHYAEVIAEHARARRLITAGQRFVDQLWGSSGEADEALGAFDLAVAESAVPARRSWKGADECADELEADLVERMDASQAGRTLGIGTPWAGVNDALHGGLQLGEVTLVAARPRSGKTALGQQLIEHAVEREGATAVIFSLEMTRKKLMMRSIARRAMVDLGRVIQGRFDSAEISRVWAALEQVRTLEQRLIIDDRRLTLHQLHRAMRWHAVRNGATLFMVDYVQLVSGRSPGQKMGEHVGEVSAMLTQTKKETGAAILALAQLNRECEKRRNPRPVLSDLGDSGKLEQDADVIVFVHRQELYETGLDAARWAGKAEARIAKNRNGPEDLIWLDFHGSQQRFTQASLQSVAS